MSRSLTSPEFLGLTTMLVVGLYQYTLLAGGQGVPSWLIGGHAHLGVLSILAIVVGFAIDTYAFTDRLRTAVTGLYVVGQWGSPLTIWLGAGAGIAFLLSTSFLWGLCLIVVMLLMAWQTALTPAVPGEHLPTTQPGDD